MSASIKELIVVAFIGAIVFVLAKPLLLRIGTSQEDYSRRRLVWYLVTIAAFLAPNFWLFSGVAICVLATFGRKDPNPAAIFLLLLYVVPDISERIPMIGISYLFSLNFRLILSFCIMAPAAARLRSAHFSGRRPGRTAMDVMLLSYCVLTAFLFVHPEISPGVLMTETPTDSIRRVFVEFFSLFVPYYAISRSLDERRKIVEALAYFCLAGCVISAVAVFEAMKHWLLYSDMVARWTTDTAMIPYLARDGSLRAAASAGHPLALGTLLASMLGLWMGVKSFVDSRPWRVAITLLLCAGLFAAYSRGPWLGAAVAYVAFVTVRGEIFTKPLKVVAIPLLVVAVVMFTPLGDKVKSVFPFLGGNVGDQNIVYRERLFDVSREIISQSPLLGDQEALLKMQDLRQGEGIIDLMNGYIVILLGSGFVGLFLYMSFILGGVSKAWAAYRRLVSMDRDLSLVGVGLVSSIVSTLLMMAGGGENDIMVCILAALALGYANLANALRAERDATANVAPRERIGQYGIP